MFSVQNFFLFFFILSFFHLNIGFCSNSFTFTGNYIDVILEEVYPATVVVQNGKISQITRLTQNDSNFSYDYIAPGYVDSHIHVESSLLPPAEFARLAVQHGVVSTVSDPHEIANVLGIPGVEFMINSSNRVLFYFDFGASPCVPASSFETSGATLSTEDIDTLFQNYSLTYLSEVMNYPGVINDDPIVMSKISVAKSYNYSIDGHAPGLTGNDAIKYISAGITTDHESTTLAEATFKIEHGMEILIREGSAAKNFAALESLIETNPHLVMLCTDDRHPNDLIDSYIDELVQRAVFTYQHNLMNVIKAATYNPVTHYKLQNSLLQIGENADMIILDQDLKVKQTYIQGNLVYDGENTLFPHSPEPNVPNNFSVGSKQVSDFALVLPQNCSSVRVIVAQNQEIETDNINVSVSNFTFDNNSNLEPNEEQDYLKIAVINRYTNESVPISIGIIHNFGLKNCAIASSVAHDSHNIIVVGTSDELLNSAVNEIINNKGGLSLAQLDQDQNITVTILPLEIAGIMSNQDGFSVAQQYANLDALAKQCGSQLDAPFMTLSFMALSVVPNLKITDLGLVDSENFVFVDICSEFNN
ncbi:adenine deaminase [Anaeramoeba ignava]|uniref:adenine deaminase n=1 Tax=Anaeramoeba ignava TaxID=1746090 RepID=A0A9Q0L875_ANAIG|nr:adenine deaminase [Anaeramoeba ignava]